MHTHTYINTHFCMSRCPHYFYIITMKFGTLNNKASLNMGYCFAIMKFILMEN
jgi:hypothetical protein